MDTEYLYTISVSVWDTCCIAGLMLQGYDPMGAPPLDIDDDELPHGHFLTMKSPWCSESHLWVDLSRLKGKVGVTILTVNRHAFPLVAE